MRACGLVISLLRSGLDVGPTSSAPPTSGPETRHVPFPYPAARARLADRWGHARLDPPAALGGAVASGIGSACVGGWPDLSWTHARTSRRVISEAVSLLKARSESD